METTSSALVALSNDLADAVSRAAESVVAVEARSRVGSSGFFVRPNLVLTASHAVEDEDEIEIVHADGASERATLAGRDPSIDVALVRSERPGTVLAASNAGALRVGSVALALARDDDGDVAATMGVVGALGGAWRTWRGGEIERWIRPDVNLYPRFSGGPLVDVRANAIGMNTWGLSRRQALTIPFATLERVADAIAAGKRIGRGYLGVALQSVRLSERVMRDAGLDEPSAIVIVDVEGGGPAERAGVVVGDVILALAERRTSDADDLAAAIAPHPVGTAVTLRMLRGGEPRDLTVEIGERSDD